MPGFKLCRHIMPTGCTCKSPAMRGSAYCYYHHGPQKSKHRALKPKELAFEIEPVSEPSCVALAADRILRALAGNKISNARAALLFQGLQTIMASFRLPDAFGPSLEEGTQSWPDLALNPAALHKSQAVIPS